MILNLWSKILIGIFLISSVAFADERIVDFSEESLGILNENLRRLREDLNRSPRIYKGDAAPTSTPQHIGDIYVRTDTDKIYVSSGTASSSDWEILN